MAKLNIQDLNLQGKKVLVRVDFNVPLDPENNIADETRIHACLPTLHYLLKAGASAILMSHLGRPKNSTSSFKYDPKLSLKPCAAALSKCLGQPVLMAQDCIGQATAKMAHDLKPNQVLLLENLRFYPAEEDPSLDPLFAQKLASLGDIYVNDAFGTAHRSHSSTASITQFFPQKAAAGLLLQKEIEFLDPLIHRPKRPFYAIIGGAKISTKLGVLEALIDKTDHLFIGGGMAFTFFKAQGIGVGKSICEDDQIQVASKLLKTCAAKKVPLFLPTDIVIADAFNNEANTQQISTTQSIPDNWQGMDIGPETVAEWTKKLKSAATVFWNGPLGVCEFPQIFQRDAADCSAACLH